MRILSFISLGLLAASSSLGAPGSSPAPSPSSSYPLLLLPLTPPTPAPSADFSSFNLPPSTGPQSGPSAPWTFWYWMRGAVSKEGITADLTAFHDIGLGGVYLVPIQDVDTPPLFTPAVRQLSPEWWTMLRHAFAEADRLGLKIAMHASDGFATAGGPWITPELSMQKVVWSTTQISSPGTPGSSPASVASTPPATRGYYRDIAVLAFPSPVGSDLSSTSLRPTVSTSLPQIDASFLIDPTNTKDRLRSESPCWFQYSFDAPFTARSLVVRPDGNSLQPLRLILETSDDGVNFSYHSQLLPPRHGWQDRDADYTFALEPVTARFFRFHFDPAGTEPGAEDFDSAKWKPVLKLRSLELSSAPRLHLFEGKNGSVWRIAPATSSLGTPGSSSAPSSALGTPGSSPASASQISNLKSEIPSACIPLSQILDLTDKLSPDGTLSWQPPSAGPWTVLRIGHTTTGHENATGGAAKGLECDKLNPAAVRLQFDRWFGETIRQVGPELAARVLTTFHVDSWECGSQNWSPVFRAEFQKRRGYDLLPFLPAMTGIPVESAAASEAFLHDVRTTVAELTHENFYGTLAQLARAHGCLFSGEATAPTMSGDGIRHFDALDIPMGEFWLRSPTHDKPADMLDAISGAHLYGKNIIQAEAFTQLRIGWDEHPAMLKALGDRQFALGINRFVFHVAAHNPWLDRRPGMTLGGVGLYFQRDQPWFRPARAWVDYLERCQRLLQQGRPVADVAVFTGEELPRRSVLPEHLIASLPGLFGPEAVARETARLANLGQPMTTLPNGVAHTANTLLANAFTDPLRGYAYDSINPDALLRLATVRDRRLVLPSGASYGVLVLPGPRPLDPSGKLSAATTQRLTEFAAAGLPILRQPHTDATLDAMGLAPDFLAYEADSPRANNIAWTHRTSDTSDLYFVSNQANHTRELRLSLRATAPIVELFDAVTGETYTPSSWQLTAAQRTELTVSLPASGSCFVLLRKNAPATPPPAPRPPTLTSHSSLLGPWQVSFSPDLGGPVQPVTFTTLTDWSTHADPAVKYYSGSATYTQTFTWTPSDATRTWLDLGSVANLAEVTLNGHACGTAWTPPYRVEITSALRPGENVLNIRVTNTWRNRLLGDRALAPTPPITFSVTPPRLDDASLLPAGLLGPVSLLQSK